MKKPISIIIVLHQDLQGYEKNVLYTDYFSWLKTELESISERDVRFFMYDHHEVPDLSGYNYKNEDGSAALRGWVTLIGDWYKRVLKSDEHEVNLTKILLLTRDNIHTKAGGLLGGIGGFGLIKGHCAIAAITTYQIPAHEIGHMFGATHEDSEVVYDGWWHDTIMLTDEFSSTRGNAYRYSDKNRDNIRKYLSAFP
ncbi:reprolysin-like metallopeptidase [Pseudomonas sp. PB101]|jgi:hypothetical protein|uniref:reprolysin-like metallopeptidase n=1 Tax=Pseudomonas sp. PB101 TaxID=2495428 RepID=UPI0013662C43|nr:hypothetical protein [Pseudomonas sp. PB101]MVW87541.1 hypothetical protein [Pseudomonas sp. PB101]